MKIYIESKLGFSESFAKKLEVFLKKEFLKVIKMEIPILGISGRDFSNFRINEIDFSASFDNLSISWASARGVKIDYLRWKSKKKLFYPHDDVSNDDIEFELIGLDKYVESLQRQIPLAFKTKKLTDFRFEVELFALELDINLKIETEKSFFEEIEKKLEEGRDLFNDRNRGLIHNIWSEESEDDVFNTRIDLGSSGMKGLKFLLKHLDKSSIPIKKAFVSGSGTG